MTVAQLLAGISSLELSEWAAYYELEPWGEERDDLRAGIVASTVANTARNAKKRRRPFKAQEFMPQFDRAEQGWERQLEVAKVMAGAGYGRIRNPHP
jgi:hypothetical protein